MYTNILKVCFSEKRSQIDDGLDLIDETWLEANNSTKLKSSEEFNNKTQFDMTHNFCKEDEICYNNVCASQCPKDTCGKRAESFLQKNGTCGCKCQLGASGNPYIDCNAGDNEYNTHQF